MAEVGKIAGLAGGINIDTRTSARRSRPQDALAGRSSQQKRGPARQGTPGPKPKSPGDAVQVSIAIFRPLSTGFSILPMVI
jgi:hypothetical protein